MMRQKMREDGFYYPWGKKKKKKKIVDARILLFSVFLSPLSLSLSLSLFLARSLAEEDG